MSTGGEDDILRDGESRLSAVRVTPRSDDRQGCVAGVQHQRLARFTGTYAKLAIHAGSGRYIRKEPPQLLFGVMPAPFEGGYHAVDRLPSGEAMGGSGD